MPLHFASCLCGAFFWAFTTPGSIKMDFICQLFKKQVILFAEHILANVLLQNYGRLHDSRNNCSDTIRRRFLRFSVVFRRQQPEFGSHCAQQNGTCTSTDKSVWLAASPLKFRTTPRTECLMSVIELVLTITARIGSKRGNCTLGFGRFRCGSFHFFSAFRTKLSFLRSMLITHHSCIWCRHITSCGDFFRHSSHITTAKVRQAMGNIYPPFASLGSDCKII